MLMIDVILWEDQCLWVEIVCNVASRTCLVLLVSWKQILSGIEKSSDRFYHTIL
jgi:hypothetical protein